MAIGKETEAKILRYHFVEKWRTGTIATQLGIHHSVVDRVLAQAGLPKVERTRRASIIDPYLPFVIDTPCGSFPHSRRPACMKWPACGDTPVAPASFASVSVNCGRASCPRRIYA